MATIQKRETQTGESRYTVRHFAGRDERGKRRFVFKTFKTLKAAKLHKGKLEAMQGDGVASKEPFGRYLERWLDVKAGMVRARTIHDYRGIVKRYITDPPDGAPPIGLIQMDKLKVDAFELLYSWMREAGLAPRTIQYTATVLRMACKDATKKGALRSNPTDNADVPTRSADEEADEDSPVRAMDDVQQDRFLEAARADRHSAYWYVLLMGGLRPSEALGLGWEHVDFDSGRVQVQRTLTRTGVDGWRLIGTKTKKSRRSITLPPVAMKELARWRAVQGRERLQLGAEYVDHGLVFTTTFGSPLSSVNLSKRNFNRIMKAAGLGEMETVGKGKRTVRRFRPAFRVYDLRHSHATWLIANGEDLKVVSERLGHSTIVLTADTYGHVLPGRQEGTSAKLEARFGG